jgi:cytochrome bd-type quinol oxidase subunit 2
MLPSTLMSADAGGSQAAAEMPEWLTYVMAGGMGLVAGVILALAQWLVLRSLGSQVRRAVLWLPANALAWLCGMPLVFLGMGAIPAGASVLQAAPFVVAATAAAGAVVGAIHGLALVRVLLTGLAQLE